MPLDPTKLSLADIGLRIDKRHNQDGTFKQDAETGNDLAVAMDQADTPRFVALSGGNVILGQQDLTGASLLLPSDAGNPAVNSEIKDVSGTLKYLTSGGSLKTFVHELIPGAGLAGSSSLSDSVTVNVGPGDGISVGADTIAVDSTVARKNIDNVFTQPQSGEDPSTSAHLTTKSYVDQQVSAVSGTYAAAVADIAALKAVAGASRQDKQLRLVDGVGSLFRFESGDSSAADDVDIVAPTDGDAPTGRWLRIQAQTQDHNALTNLNAGDYKHLTAFEYAAFIPNTRTLQVAVGGVGLAIGEGAQDLSANRTFTLTGSLVDHDHQASGSNRGGKIDHGLALNGLGDDDHTQYVLVSGARAFSGTVGGVTPTDVAHLTTKGYVDGLVVTDHGALTGLGDDDHPQYILVSGARAFSGNQSFGGFQAVTVRAEQVASASEPSAGAGTKGRFWFDSTNNKLRYDDGTTLRTLHETAVSGNGISIAGVGSLKTVSLSIGTGATQVAAGNHGHAGFASSGLVLTAGSGLTGGGDLTTGRTFNVGAGDGVSVAADSVAVDASVVRTTRAITASTGLSGGGDLSANRNFAVVYGTGSGTACQGNDARLHTQNTDTGTNQNTFSVGDGASGNKILQANNADANKPKLRYNDTGNVWEFSNNGIDFAAMGSGGGGVTSVSGTAPITSTGGVTPAIGINDATTTTKGAVELATDGETGAGVVVQGNDSRLPNRSAGFVRGKYIEYNSNTEIIVRAAGAELVNGISHVNRSVSQGVNRTVNATVVGVDGLSTDVVGGALASDTWYYVFLISQDQNDIDVRGLISAALTVPALPATYNLFLRVGSFRTDGGGNLIPATQTANTILYKSPQLLVANDGTTSLFGGVDTDVTTRIHPTSTTGVFTILAQVDPAINGLVQGGIGVETVGPYGALSTVAVRAFNVAANANPTSAQVQGLCGIRAGVIKFGWNAINGNIDLYVNGYIEETHADH